MTTIDTTKIREVAEMLRELHKPTVAHGKWILGQLAQELEETLAARGPVEVQWCARWVPEDMATRVITRSRARDEAWARWHAHTMGTIPMYRHVGPWTVAPSLPLMLPAHVLLVFLVNLQDHMSALPTYSPERRTA